MVSIWGSCLKLLLVVYASCLSISISTNSSEALDSRWAWSLSLSPPLILLLHIQFPQDMCTCLHDALACSIPLGYVRVLFVLTHKGVLGEWSTRDDKGNSVGSMIYLKFWWPSGEPPWWVVYWGKRTY